MLGRVVGLAAVCAVGASALLLPPGIASASDGSPDLALSRVNPKDRSIRIPCAECAFPETRRHGDGGGDGDVGHAKEDEDWVWVQGGAKDLLLDFTISKDGRALHLGGGHIYPPMRWQVKPLMVTQVARKSSGAEVEVGDGARVARLQVREHTISASQELVFTVEGDEVLDLRLQIGRLQDESMTLDEVRIKMLQMDNGELFIMKVEAGPAQPGSIPTPFAAPPSPVHEVDAVPADEGFLSPPSTDMEVPPFPFHHGRPHGPHGFGNFKECDVLPAPLCRLKNILESKIDATIGPPHSRKTGRCRGRKGMEESKKHHGPPTEFLRPGQEDRSKHHHGRPHHMRPHNRHHRHRHGHFWRHHFMHAFAKGLVAVLIPVMAGITVGMSVSLLGLIVGRLIGYLWIRLVRGGKRGYASVAQEEVALEAEMEAPPLYEDAPAYEEKEREER